MKQIDARIYNGKTNFEWKDLELNSEGLLPVIVQDYIDHTVLMYTYMDESAWEKTLATGLLTYYSKSHKRDIELFLNGEKNALLIKVYPMGPACDDSKKSCFSNEIEEI